MICDFITYIFIKNTGFLQERNRIKGHLPWPPLLTQLFELPEQINETQLKDIGIVYPYILSCKHLHFSFNLFYKD